MNKIENETRVVENPARTKSDKAWICGIAIVLLFVSAVFLCGFAINMGAERVLLGEHIYSTELLGEAMLEYAESTGKWPDADQWCDEIDIEEIMLWSLIYKDDQPQCNFSMNKDAIGLAGTMPDDMVLLFESEYGWNNSGGVEIAKARVPGIIQVVFGNGDVKAIPENSIHQLRWKVNQKTSLLTYNPEPVYTITLIAISVVLLGIIVAFRVQLRRYWILTVCIAVGTAGVSFILGGLSAILYYSGTSGSPDILFLTIPGFLLGVAFVPVLGKICTRLNKGQGFIGLSVLAGAVTGIIGSTIVHVLMMIFYQDSSVLKPLGGAGFGIIAGMVLGFISGVFVRRFYCPKQNEPITEGI